MSKIEQQPIEVIAAFTGGKIEPMGFHVGEDTYVVSRVIGYTYQAPEIVLDVQGASFTARLVFNRLTLTWVLAELTDIPQPQIAPAAQGAL